MRYYLMAPEAGMNSCASDTNHRDQRLRFCGSAKAKALSATAPL
jgi:hypothetical protein